MTSYVHAQPLYEICSGTAALALYLHGAKPPCSRIGSKAGYAAQIAEVLGLELGSRPVTLVDADPKLQNAMSWLLAEPLYLAETVNRRSGGDPRTVWEGAKLAKTLSVTSVEAAAAWWLWTAGARGGIGGFKGGHVRRASVDGFIPSRVSLIKRIQKAPVLSRYDVVTVCVDVSKLPAREMPKNAVVYIDPPYWNTQGYGPKLGHSVVCRIALMCRDRGCVVGVSERRGVLEDAPGVEHVRLERRGQKRRSMTTSDEEWLTVLRP